MSDFRLIQGFEDAWRPPVRTGARSPASPVARPVASPRETLSRLARRAPEVLVKVTGRTKDAGALNAHLTYISRNGALSLEDRDGAVLDRRADGADRAKAWALEASVDHRRRSDTPLSHSVILSMPAGADPLIVRDAARAFARTVFASERDYLFTLHTDTPRPHVHLAVCSRGDTGTRLNPRKADLELWRQIFAQALRDRGLEAEATPRRARGQTRKAERAPLLRIRRRAEAGRGAPGKVARAALQTAARTAFGPAEPKQPWEERLLARQSRIRALYLAQAHLLTHSDDATDRALGAQVESFIRDMPPPDSQRLALARQLREANHRARLAEDAKTHRRER